MTDFNITVSASDIMSALDYSEIVENLDAGDLWRNLRDEIDYSSIAESVVDYIDIDGLVSDALYNRSYDYLTSDSLMDLMDSYNPENTCSLGKATTNTISKGMKHMLDDFLTNGSNANSVSNEMVTSLVEVIKMVAGQSSGVIQAVGASSQVDQTVSVQASQVPETASSALFSFADLSAIVYQFVNRFSYYTMNYSNNMNTQEEFDSFFSEALRVIQPHLLIDLEQRVDSIIPVQH